MRRSWSENVLHQFTGGKDGGGPEASVTFGPAGNLYGTTYQGGNLNYCNSGCGVVFKLVPNSKGGWYEVVLHGFLAGPSANPLGDLIFDAAGNLYGTTSGDNSGNKSGTAVASLLSGD